MDASPTDDELASTGNASRTEPVSPDGTLAPGRTARLPGRQGRAVRLAAGERIAIENIFGTQVVDAFAFVADDLSEHMSMTHVRAHLRRIALKVGDTLVTNRRRPLLTLEEDTSPGVHDTLIAACDRQRYAELGVTTYHDSCADNLALALAAIGLSAPTVPAPLNLFMNIPVRADGTLDYLPPVSRPGDRVVLRAERDTILVLSACPMDLSTINGPDKTPRDITLEVLG